MPTLAKIAFEQTNLLELGLAAGISGARKVFAEIAARKHTLEM